MYGIAGLMAGGALWAALAWVAPAWGIEGDMMSLLDLPWAPPGTTDTTDTPTRLPSDWLPLTFPKVPRHTEYTLIHDELGRPVIRAVSKQSASGLYHRLDLNPAAYPVLSWCWKVDRIIAKGDEKTKQGDDYAARIYVTFKYDPAKVSLWERTKYGAIRLFYGDDPPKAAINYIWANRLPKGETIPNAYTDRARMLAVESGPKWVGRWICEGRNLYDDYLRLFAEPPPRLAGIAIMTDTDNTGEEATAFYADLTLYSADFMTRKVKPSPPATRP